MKQISITWNVEDIKSVDNTLTEKQCEDVLELLKNDHDASLGINWDVIACTITSYKNGL